MNTLDDFIIKTPKDGTLVKMIIDNPKVIEFQSNQLAEKFEQISIVDSAIKTPCKNEEQLEVEKINTDEDIDEISKKFSNLDQQFDKMSDDKMSDDKMSDDKMSDDKMSDDLSQDSNSNSNSSSSIPNKKKKIAKKAKCKISKITRISIKEMEENDLELKNNFCNENFNIINERLFKNKQSFILSLHFFLNKNIIDSWSNEQEDYLSMCVLTCYLKPSNQCFMWNETKQQTKNYIKHKCKVYSDKYKMNLILLNNPLDISESKKIELIYFYDKKCLTINEYNEYMDYLQHKEKNENIVLIENKIFKNILSCSINNANISSFIYTINNVKIPILNIFKYLIKLNDNIV